MRPGSPAVAVLVVADVHACRGPLGCAAAVWPAYRSGGCGFPGSAAAASMQSGHTSANALEANALEARVQQLHKTLTIKGNKPT